MNLHFRSLQHGSYNSLCVQVDNRILTGMDFCLGEKKKSLPKNLKASDSSVSNLQTASQSVFLLFFRNGFNIKTTHSVWLQQWSNSCYLIRLLSIRIKYFSHKHMDVEHTAGWIALHNSKYCLPWKNSPIRHRTHQLRSICMTSSWNSFLRIITVS